MSGQNLAYLAVIIASGTLLLAIASVVSDRKHRQRLEMLLGTATRCANARGETLTRVRQAVEEGSEAIELEGPVSDWGHGYLACADVVLQELDQ